MPARNFRTALLFAADAAGGLAAGLILESRGLLPPKVTHRLHLGDDLVLRARGICPSRATTLVAITLLFVAGFVELGFNSMAQSLVQLNAPAEIRGRVIGVFSMSAMGLRTFSGLSVGLLGASIGIHNSLSYSAAALFLYSRRSSSRAACAGGPARRPPQ